MLSWLDFLPVSPRPLQFSNRHLQLLPGHKIWSWLMVHSHMDVSVSAFLSKTKQNKTKQQCTLEFPYIHLLVIEIEMNVLCLKALLLPPSRCIVFEFLLFTYLFPIFSQINKIYFYWLPIFVKPTLISPLCNLVISFFYFFKWVV